MGWRLEAPRWNAFSIAKNMKKSLLLIWCYFKDSWEGKDGKFSYRRFFQWAFGISAIIIGTNPQVSETGFKITVVFCAMFLLMAGIMTVQNLLEFFRTQSLKEPVQQGAESD